MRSWITMACDIDDWCAEGTTISVSKPFFWCLVMLQAEFISSVEENL